MTECKHGSLCPICETERETDRLILLAFMEGASMERIGEVLGWDDPADVEAAIRRVAVIGGAG